MIDCKVMVFSFLLFVRQLRIFELPRSKVMVSMYLYKDNSLISLHICGSGTMLCLFNNVLKNRWEARSAKTF